MHAERQNSSKSSLRIARQCGIEFDPTNSLLDPSPPPGLKPSSDPTSILPYPQQFAVVQMDPVAMLVTAGVADSIALREAEALVTKKYLVYLDMIMDLPMSHSESCRYNVFPVATTLRPENPEMGITHEMVLLIHPNQAHLVVPNPFICQQDPAHTFEFRFKNWFLWIYSDTVLRIRVKRDNDAYDNSKAVSLTSGQHVKMTNSFGPHLDCITNHIQTKYQKASLSRSLTAARTGTPFMPLAPEFDAVKGCLPVVLDTEDTPDRDDQWSLHNLSRWRFGPALKYTPLVNCWLELEEHLNETTMPNPVELWTEQQRIGAIINDAIARHNAKVRRRNA